MNTPPTNMIQYQLRSTYPLCKGTCHLWNGMPPRQRLLPDDLWETSSIRVDGARNVRVCRFVDEEGGRRCNAERGNGGGVMGVA
jgi:hypothetical protein